MKYCTVSTWSRHPLSPNQIRLGEGGYLLQAETVHIIGKNNGEIWAEIVWRLRGSTLDRLHILLSKKILEGVRN